MSVQRELAAMGMVERIAADRDKAEAEAERDALKVEVDLHLPHGDRGHVGINSSCRLTSTPATTSQPTKVNS